VAQTNLNNYKYIVVPNKYDFLKFEDEYQLNSLTKFLFEKSDFIVLAENDKYPSDLASNNCLGLKVDVKSIASLFKTKINIALRDCENNTVYTSIEGVSKEKDFKRGYHEALRNAFEGFDQINYVYDEGSAQKSIPIETKVKAEVVSKTIIVKAPEVQKAIRIEKPEKEPTIKKEKKAMKISKVEKEVKETVIKPIKNITIKTVEGRFNFDKWGISTISKEGEMYLVRGGDENFEYATIYKTSNPAIFIIKWQAFKQPQLLQIDSDGNLKVDSENGVRTYKRVH
jgi:hypothetical protein